MVSTIEYNYAIIKEKNMQFSVMGKKLKGIILSEVRKKKERNKFKRFTLMWEIKKHNKVMTNGQR